MSHLQNTATPTGVPGGVVSPTPAHANHICAPQLRDHSRDALPVPEYLGAIEPRLQSPVDEEEVAELEVAKHDLGVTAPLARVDSIGPPPDGGLTAWLVVIGSSLIMFCVFGFVTGMGQLQAYYLAHQLKDYSKATVAWIAALQLMLTFTGAVLSGRIFDAYNVRPMVVASTLGGFGALVAVAFSKEYYQFLLAHALFGISGSIVYSPATAIAAHWFVRKRGTAIGIIMCGAGLGGILYPIMIKNLTDRLRFRDAMLIFAGIHFALMLPGCVFVKKRLPNRPPVPWSALRLPWKDIRFCFLMTGMSFGALAVFSPYFNAALYASSNHASPAVVGYAVPLLQTGNFFGRLASGQLADRLGTWTVFMSAGILAAVSLFAFWIGEMNTPAVVVGLVAYGFTSGAHITLASAAMATISHPAQIGLRLGMLWSGLSIPMLIGPFVTGQLIARGHNTYKWAAVFQGLVLGIASLTVGGPIMVRALIRRGQSIKAEEGSECADTTPADKV